MIRIEKVHHALQSSHSFYFETLAHMQLGIVISAVIEKSVLFIHSSAKRGPCGLPLGDTPPR